MANIPKRTRDAVIATESIDKDSRQTTFSTLSIIVPAFNESETIIELHRQLSETLALIHVQFEIIIVDDGSTDSTWKKICIVTENDPHVHGIRLRVRSGKTAALNVAFKESKGDVIVTLDADLQDTPSDIPNLLRQMENGYDFVSGWKKTRLDPWHKTWPSKFFNLMLRMATGLNIHDHNCGLKCFRRCVIEEIHLFGDLHRFTVMLAHRRGFRIGELAIHHRPRIHGSSKYGMSRVVWGFLDLIMVTFMIRFIERPFQFLGLLGAIPFCIGSLGLTYLGIIWLAGYGPIGTRPLMTYSAAAFLFGTQMLALGLLAEMILWQRRIQTDRYPIAEHTRNQNS